MIRKIIYILTFLVSISLMCILFIQINEYGKNSTILDEMKSSAKVLTDPSLRSDGKSLLGEKFIEFSMETIDGEFYIFSNDKAICKVIIFFNTKDCAGCLNEYRLWKTIHNKFSTEKARVIGICNDISINDIIAFIKPREIGFKIIHDPGNKVRRSMGFRFSPLRIILNKHNDIISVATTQTNNDEQRAVINMISGIVEMD